MVVMQSDSSPLERLDFIIDFVLTKEGYGECYAFNDVKCVNSLHFFHRFLIGVGCR
jgi:hypothetical protein